MTEKENMTESQGGGQYGGEGAAFGYDSGGLYLEIDKGPPLKNVRIMINADLGPEGYSVEIQEIPVGKKVTIPYSDFRNPQGFTYSPCNFRSGRTIIESGGRVVRGYLWETAL